MTISKLFVNYNALPYVIFQDYIDQFFVWAVYYYPQPRSIFWCFRNLVHGLAIYMLILFLSHLSDFQGRRNSFECPTTLPPMSHARLLFYRVYLYFV